MEKHNEMPKYYVNDNAQPTGEHEVHSEYCKYLPFIKSKTDLGYHSGCYSAVRKAQQYYLNVDGCAECSELCHKR